MALRKIAALAALCGSGAILGLMVAWFGSPFYRLTQSAISGEWANYTATFLWWSASVSQWWPFSALGAALIGLPGLAIILLSTGSRK